ncbi:hypothetical protein QWY16_09970 [Planococcus shenhongbingii]|uniref:Uncharacterized protein n=1 Tax=Planococcus shenhongbingii TaxID=3058398 RepID=A0ABT8NGC1_9BACL|nr:MULTISPECIES: hypothetical protein [unclassified Planococcus (in: firmicutes)]MDN7246940.1 hypothetical protein [Planococcus sp. N017]WKA56843.1 hypothetical protein QWY16_09970 [Planococcus sp. N016]
MNDTSSIQMIAAVAIFGLMVAVPLIMVFMVYKFGKRSGKQ